MQQDFIVNLVNQGHHAVIAVHGDQYSFAYTIGLTEVNLPELIIFGPSAQAAHMLLNITAHLMRENGEFVDGQTSDDIANLVTGFKTVTNEAVKQYACQALFFYEDKIKQPRFLQVVIPDRAGKLPWKRGFDSQYMDQRQPQLWKPD